MNNLRYLAPAAYMVALVLFVVPIVDASLSVAPWQIGSTQWRYGAVGLLSNALMLPSLGALLGALIAVGLNHYKTQRAIGISSWVMVAIVFVGLVMFVLDAIQARGMIRPQMALSYQVASITALVKLLLGGAVFWSLGRACNVERVTRPEPSMAKGKRDLATSS